MHPLAIFSVVGFALVGDGHRKARGFKGGKAPLWGQGATPLQDGNSSAFPCHAEGWHRGSRYDIAILLLLLRMASECRQVDEKCKPFTLRFVPLVAQISKTKKIAARCGYFSGKVLLRVANQFPCNRLLVVRWHGVALCNRSCC